MNERSVTFYYDWFLHLDPAKNQRQEPTILKNYWALTDLLYLLNVAAGCIQKRNRSLSAQWALLP